MNAVILDLVEAFDLVFDTYTQFKVQFFFIFLMKISRQIFFKELTEERVK